MLVRSRVGKYIKAQSGRKIKRLPRHGVIVCLEMIGGKTGLAVQQLRSCVDAIRARFWSLLG